MKFKIGDKVERIGGWHNYMEIGNTDTITKIIDSGAGLILKKYSPVKDNSHMASNFKLVPSVDNEMLKMKKKMLK